MTDGIDELTLPDEASFPDDSTGAIADWPGAPESPGEGLSGDEIEQAYQKALAAMGDVPWEPAAIDPATVAPIAATNVEPEEHAGSEAPTENEPPLFGPPADAATKPVKPQRAGPRLASGTERQPPTLSYELSQVTPAQIVEAALFVGGGALTAKKLCALLRGSFDTAFIDSTIDELNRQYHAEARPYEILSGEGGYRLELRAEHEKLRQRVYGSGPREVKLSQDVLEVLALVAYRQPISQAEIEQHGKQNAGNLLRQLLRRDLVSIQRGEGGRKDVRYLTTPRFLQVFGIGSLDELPHPDDLARK